MFGKDLCHSYRFTINEVNFSKIRVGCVMVNIKIWYSIRIQDIPNSVHVRTIYGNNTIHFTIEFSFDLICARQVSEIQRHAIFVHHLNVFSHGLKRKPQAKHGTDGISIRA